MNRAYHVVRALLGEAHIASVCMYCAKEFQLPHAPPDVELSHGLCRRHFIEYMLANGFSADEIQQDLLDTSQTPVVDIASLSPEERLDWRKVFS